ncbi:MAG: hypothetical protein UV36_C0043G0010 [Parcubacteria group bacterium GW2011_GWC2_42_6]|nr:MAG: hypothetical protein UV36_C0043G0010 [Parcubacteria group bacterium GW2011_GWC2_42_6]
MPSQRLFKEHFRHCGAFARPISGRDFSTSQLMKSGARCSVLNFLTNEHAYNFPILPVYAGNLH